MMKREIFKCQLNTFMQEASKITLIAGFIILCVFANAVILSLLPWPEMTSEISPVFSRIMGFGLGMWALGSYLVVLFSRELRSMDYVMLSGLVLILMFRGVLPKLLNYEYSLQQFAEIGFDPFTIHVFSNLSVIVVVSVVGGAFISRLKTP